MQHSFSEEAERESIVQNDHTNTHLTPKHPLWGRAPKGTVARRVCEADRFRRRSAPRNYTHKPQTQKTRGQLRLAARLLFTQALLV